jgi:hypothetical protein
LPSTPCSFDGMTALMKMKFDFRMDGLLFYHSEVFNFSGYISNSNLAMNNLFT